MRLEKELVKNWTIIETVVQSRIKRIELIEPVDHDLVMAWKDVLDVVQQLKLAIGQLVQVGKNIESLAPLLRHDLRNADDWLYEPATVVGAEQMTQYISGRISDLRGRLTEKEEVELELQLTARFRDADA